MEGEREQDIIFGGNPFDKRGRLSLLFYQNDAKGIAPIKEKIMAGVKYITYSDGTILLYDEEFDKPIYLSQISTAERKCFYARLSEELKSNLPKGYELITDNEKCRLAILNEKAEEIGFLNYSAKIDEDHLRDALKIDFIHSSIKGGATLLLAEALKMFPETERIISELDEDNYTNYKAALEEGLDHYAALRKTPANGYHSNCGFNIISRGEKVSGNGNTLMVSIAG